MPRLAGKVAIVTGAGSGIGRACALALAREAAAVALVGRRKDRLEEVAQQIGKMALTVPTDVTDKGDIDRVVAQTLARFGALHVLVNNVGVLHAGTCEQTSE